ncbi:hypothetical protein H0H93_003062 [Arthromyces matolae]|nr:hypothetical protein H0H93_003062 [Arthromyces matolae]
MDILKLASILKQYEDIHAALPLDAGLRYVDVARLLRPVLQRPPASYRLSVPERLPLRVHEFFKQCFVLSDDVGKLVWDVMKEFIWALPSYTPSEELACRTRHIQLFLEHGFTHGIGNLSNYNSLCRMIDIHTGVYNLGPPRHHCIDPGCCESLEADGQSRQRDLKEPVSHPITVFTKEFGAVPGYTTSLYCRKCLTRYYPNYFVHHNATKRTYYPRKDIHFIQLSQHFYMSDELCELFTMMMVTSWTSATHCATVYNTGLQNQSVRAALPPSWPTSLELDVDDVWNAFFLYALIEDHGDSSTVLELVHNASSQALRLQPALQDRNRKMAGPGQEAWNHACDLCCWVFTDEMGITRSVRSAVTDGVAIGCPCCSVQDCSEPLPTVKHRFCNFHRHLSTTCAVTTCERQVEGGFKTCSLDIHRSIETYSESHGKAMFQLKHRLEKLSTARNKKHGSQRPIQLPLPLDNDSVGDSHDFSEYDANGVCDGKPEAGNRLVRARFGRRRTHNEELCVASCGVILGRVTMFGSEAPNGVRAFWMKLFPTKASIPTVMWHDNNCRIVAMIKNDDDPFLRHYFDGCALPVDVFHFMNKHKETDTACGENCNPLIWGDLLVTEDKQWRFNSSAAEQTNAWMGGYQAMVREMSFDRYEFFLDEIIKRRNRITISELRRKLKSPYSIPREELMQTDPS